MKILTALGLILFLIAFAIGLPLLGWGIRDWQGFFVNPARLAFCLAVIAFALVVSAWLLLQSKGYDLSKRGGDESKRISRQNIVPLIARLVWFAILLVAPYSDRRLWMVIEGSEAVRYAGLALFILSLAWVVWAFFTLGRQHSGAVTIQPGHQLVTAGPYRWVRHPMYLGLITFPLGAGLVFRSWIGALLPVLLIGLFAWRIGDEERLMQQEFGEGWRQYCQHTRKLIPFLFSMLLGILVAGLSLPGKDLTAQAAGNHQSQTRLVILADPIDPYYPLAEEIAQAEGAPIAHTLPEALAYQPVYLIWVVSPAGLSDAVMIEHGQTMKEQAQAISTGIISGSSLEKARSLWKKHSQVHGESFLAANASNPAAHIDEGRLIEFTPQGTNGLPLTEENFIRLIQTADYLTFTGHGGNSYLRLGDEVKITPHEIPPLQGVIIATGSCQTFRLWNADSIALRFADQGAAAYSGFVFSPNEGYLIGEFDGLPFRYTWQDFPIGHVIQVQNRGTLQGFAAFPYQYLLGDPRLALQSLPPYQWVDEAQKGEQRILTYRELPAGVIPLRIPNGANYAFVEAEGITSASEQDPFYNSRLQMADIQEDKYLLVVHPGGDLTIKLRRQAPWHWRIGDLVIDSLDDTYIFSPQSSGDIISLGFACLPLLWTGWQAIKRRLSWKVLRLALFVASLTALFRAAYVLLRLDRLTITSKIVEFSPLSILAAFLLSGFGTLLFLQARSRRGKGIALLVLTFESWSVFVFGSLVIGILNLGFFIPQTGAALYNYALGLLPVAAFLITLALYGFTLPLIQNGTSQALSRNEDRDEH